RIQNATLFQFVPISIHSRLTSEIGFSLTRERRHPLGRAIGQAGPGRNASRDGRRLWQKPRRLVTAKLQGSLQLRTDAATASAVPGENATVATLCRAVVSRRSKLWIGTRNARVPSIAMCPGARDQGRL